MKKIFIFLAILVLSSNLGVLANQDTYKSKLFMITIPQELKGTYWAKTGKDSVMVYHKDSKKAGYGGFAFGVEAYKNPADYAVSPGRRKIGELTDKKGVLYDIVLEYPTDVQYDYTKSPDAPEAYMKLYDLGKDADIQGINGATYYQAQGTRGEDLYKDILKKHITAVKEKWDSIKLEEENMSYMYNILALNGTNVLNKAGYIYYDVNSDGIDELLVGEIADGNWKGVIYDIYTVVNRVPEHVVSGGSRNIYYVCNESFVCNEYSSGALENGLNVYFLTENSTELFPQVSFKYDGYKNSKKPWFLSYGTNSDDKWENVSEEVYNDRKRTFSRYRRFDYIPLSKISDK